MGAHVGEGHEREDKGEEEDGVDVLRHAVASGRAA